MVGFVTGGGLRNLIHSRRASWGVWGDDWLLNKRKICSKSRPRPFPPSIRVGMDILLGLDDQHGTHRITYKLPRMYQHGTADAAIYAGVLDST